MTAATPPPLQQFTTDHFLIQAAGVTDRGQVRSHNEDRLGLLPDAFRALAVDLGYLFAVADGMGGAEKGEVASDLAVTTLFEAFYHHPSELEPEAALERAFQLANAVVYREGQQLRFGMMGTTLVACLLVGHRAIIANVGDSRAYLIRQGRLRQVTEDHSWVAEQVRHQLMTPEEAQTSPQRNIITRAIGHQPTVEVALYTLTDLQPGDVLLLCSDGLHGMVPDPVLAAVPLDGDLAAAAQQFVDLANQAGGQDNITCLLIRLMAAAQPSGGPPELADTQRLAPRPTGGPGAPVATPDRGPAAGGAPLGTPAARAVGGEDALAARPAPRRRGSSGKRWGVALASTLAVGGVAALAVGLVVARGAAPSNIVSAPVQPTGVGSPTPATAPTAQVAPPAGTSGSQGAGFVTVEGAVQLPFGTAVLGEKDWRGDVYVVAVEPRTGARFESRVATEEGAGWDYRLKLPPGTYQLSIEPEVAFRTPTGDRQVFRLHCTALIEPRGVEILDLVLQPAAPGGAASGEAMPPCEPSALSEASDGQQGAVELVPRAAGPTVGP